MVLENPSCEIRGDTHVLVLTDADTVRAPSFDPRLQSIIGELETGFDLQW